MVALEDDSPYATLSRALCAADPRLQNWRVDTKPNPARVVALEIHPDQSAEWINEFIDPQSLRDKLATPSTESSTVYILEGITPAFVDILGIHFDLHPSVFLDHERLVALAGSATGEAGGIPFLASAAIQARDHITMKYHEPLLLSPVPEQFRNFCEASGRHIAVTRILGAFSPVGLARRKCSFWSVPRTTGNGWDCLVICDPPVTTVRAGYSDTEGREIKTMPYSGGYVDFTPHKEQLKHQTGPPRSSMLDDISFYLQTYGYTFDLTNPLSVRTILEKIIASHYTLTAKYLRETIELVQWNLSRQQNLAIFSNSTAEEQWSDIQAWDRRLSEYKDDIQAIMLQLGIPFEPPNITLVQGWKDSAIDYQFLLHQFNALHDRVRDLNNAITGLAGITSSHQAYTEQKLALKASKQSLHEARRAKTLTLVGLVFIPLAYVASLFSMAEPYMPGSERFWVYFAIAFPMSGMMLAVYYLFSRGYSSHTETWSVCTLLGGILLRRKA
ncbi:hypothetical protein BJY04DRAFT_167406 [Aspergillus karnatakaensis]|uniref:uncharacterized protein n=1 Tax=Aspergillus karnatakaensis TaxID=1810916 RepID=UPI003CCD390C